MLGLGQDLPQGRADPALQTSTCLSVEQVLLRFWSMVERDLGLLNRLRWTFEKYHTSIVKWPNLMFQLSLGMAWGGIKALMFHWF